MVSSTNTGTYTSSFSIGIKLRGEVYDAIDPKTLVISAIGPLGGAISGTFTCTFSNTNTGQVAVVNDGVFRVQNSNYTNVGVVAMMMLGP